MPKIQRASQPRVVQAPIGTTGSGTAVLERPEQRAARTRQSRTETVAPAPATQSAPVETLYDQERAFVEQSLLDDLAPVAQPTAETAPKSRTPRQPRQPAPTPSADDGKTVHQRSAEALSRRKAELLAGEWEVLATGRWEPPKGLPKDDPRARPPEILVNGVLQPVNRSCTGWPIKKWVHQRRLSDGHEVICGTGEAVKYGHVPKHEVKIKRAQTKSEFDELFEEMPDITIPDSEGVWFEN